jgi:hypothetical protein
MIHQVVPPDISRDIPGHLLTSAPDHHDLSHVNTPGHRLVDG